MFPIYYHVAPRFTAGSPAQVDLDTANRLVKEEISAAYRTMQAQDKCDVEPSELQGIVYATFERDGMVEVRDLITGEWFTVPYEDWYKQGWSQRSDRMKFRTTFASWHPATPA